MKKNCVRPKTSKPQNNTNNRIGGENKFYSPYDKRKTNIFIQTNYNSPVEKNMKKLCEFVNKDKYVETLDLLKIVFNSHKKINLFAGKTVKSSPYSNQIRSNRSNSQRNNLDFYPSHNFPFTTRMSTGNILKPNEDSFYLNFATALLDYKHKNFKSYYDILESLSCNYYVVLNKSSKNFENFSEILKLLNFTYFSSEEILNFLTDSPHTMKVFLLLLQTYFLKENILKNKVLTQLICDDINCILCSRGLFRQINKKTIDYELTKSNLQSYLNNAPNSKKFTNSEEEIKSTKSKSMISNQNIKENILLNTIEIDCELNSQNIKTNPCLMLSSPVNLKLTKYMSPPLKNKKVKKIGIVDVKKKSIGELARGNITKRVLKPVGPTPPLPTPETKISNLILSLQKEISVMEELVYDFSDKMNKMRIGIDNI